MFPLPITTYIKLAAVAAVLLLTFYFGWHLRDTDFQSYKAKQSIEMQKLQEDYQTKAAKIESEKNAQIRIINSQLVDAISELRKRPSRTTEAGNGQSGTGSSLFAEDAIFLTREAARADEIRAALDACYKQYDSLK